MICSIFRRSLKNRGRGRGRSWSGPCSGCSESARCLLIYSPGGTATFMLGCPWGIGGVWENVSKLEGMDVFTSGSNRTDSALTFMFMGGLGSKSRLRKSMSSSFFYAIIFFPILILSVNTLKSLHIFPFPLLVHDSHSYVFGLVSVSEFLTIRSSIHYSTILLFLLSALISCREVWARLK